MRVPLSCLPGSLPVGAPRVRVYSCDMAGHPEWLPPEDISVEPPQCPDCGRPQRWHQYDALDLSAPPLDADGWPTRVDGYPIGLAMLARARGAGREPELLPNHGGGVTLYGDDWAIYGEWFADEIPDATDPRRALAIILGASHV